VKGDLIEPAGRLLALSVILTLWPNKALQLTPSRHTPLFTTAHPFHPATTRAQRPIGVAELGVRCIK